MTLGGKRHTKKRGNSALKSWVAFVKKVAKEEKLSYRDAMMRAKKRKDKGEKWMMKGMMKGGVASVDAPQDLNSAHTGNVEDSTAYSSLGSSTVGGKKSRKNRKSRKSRKSRRVRK